MERAVARPGRPAREAVAIMRKEEAKGRAARTLEPPSRRKSWASAVAWMR